jgi:hypothetical protein
VKRAQSAAVGGGSLHHPSFPTSVSTSDQHFEPSFSFQIA